MNPNGTPDETQTPEAGKAEGQDGTSTATFADFLAKQPDDIKALYEEDVKGLKNTVAAVREERDTFAAQVRELGKKVEKGSDLEAQLNKLAAQAEQANRRADFLESASTHECRNPKAAYAIAIASDLFDKKGNPDWNAIKAAAPELFGKRVVKTNAGSGAEEEPVAGNDMNTWIRRQAR